MSVSPCNGICQLHPVKGICLGCGRTGEEIGRWGSLTTEDRRVIMERLPHRMRRAGFTAPETEGSTDARE